MGWQLCTLEEVSVVVVVDRSRNESLLTNRDTLSCILRSTAQYMPCERYACMEQDEQVVRVEKQGYHSRWDKRHYLAYTNEWS